MKIDDYVELRGRCFNLLEDIAMQQMKIAANIHKAKNVKDWSLYLQKRNTELNALSNAKSTLDTIIKNVDKQGNIEDTLKRIEAAVKASKNGG